MVIRVDRRGVAIASLQTMNQPLTQSFPIGLSPGQFDSLRALGETLSPGQSVIAARWLLARLDTSALSEDRLVQTHDTEASAATGLTVLYGSHSGHSAAIAKDLASQARNKGWTVVLSNMADYSRGSLKREKNLAIVVSTHGEGQPPESIAAFYDFLHGARAPKLDQCGFAVLGLGDKSYVHFCKTGADFDRRLAELGAGRLLDRVDLDLDYQDGAEAWTSRVLEAFAPRMILGKPAATPPVASRVVRRFDRENPWSAELLDAMVLSGRGSTQHYVHLELSLEGSRIKYEPGDALGVRPSNDLTLVAQILETLGDKRGTPVKIAGVEWSLGEALARRLELSRVMPSSLRKYSAYAGSKLAELLATAGQVEQYVLGRDWLDVLREFPSSISGAELVALLPDLASRSYSIASCQSAHPDEVHLLVSHLSYEAHGRPRSGVASGYLAHRVSVSDRIPIWLEPNSSFRLPADPDVPIIMIGAGTGIAPFRAFVEARTHAGAKGKNWVIFGNRSFRCDFTYQTEWLRWREQGILTRMDAAFSRDQARKVYVTEKMLDSGREVVAWLDAGAHIYLCGDRTKLSQAVDRALMEILVKHAGQTQNQAMERVEQLQAEHRYLKDVY